ncbi:hypothetical protein [Halorubrum sp. Atlit-26R]|uniref:hypothetical protein n=1 Tax=Halorubrum sp. Atlit-26R TaxID=2282128 RepID=UPI000EF28CC6|nr:hypothetical protein [Halorubrum sp. Atlit-26R]RLM68629.1 hypothetical protein DVK07_10965 [Halorubrum sp. Atlit-26R]
MPEDNRTSKSQNRRGFLKLSAGALSAAAIPATASASEDEVSDSSDESSENISAEMVDPNKPETARDFVRKAVDLEYSEDAKEAFDNLSDEQLDAVRDAYDDLATTEFTVDTPDDVNTDAVSPESTTVEGDATITQSIAGVTAYTFTLGLEFEVENGEIDGSPTAHFDPNPQSPVWHYEHIEKGYPGEDTPTSTEYTAIGEFKHSVLGEVIDRDYPKINLVGHADGTFDSSKTILESAP